VKPLIVAAWIAIASCPLRPLPAQRLEAVAAGTRMRLTLCNGDVVVGESGYLRGDSLDVVITERTASKDAPPLTQVRRARSIALDSIRTYAVVVGRKGRGPRGALIGAGLGLALIGAAAAGDIAFERRGGAAQIPGVALATPVALVFVLVGAAFGSASGEERWSEPQYVHAIVLPTPRGLRAAVSVGF
jgi:hypothetical protein